MLFHQKTEYKTKIQDLYLRMKLDVINSNHNFNNDGFKCNEPSLVLQYGTMKTVYIFLFILLFQNANAQVTSDVLQDLNREILVMEFDSLSSIPYIDTNQLFDQHCCSLLILSLLETGIQDSIFVNCIFERALQIARKHFEEGRAVLILNPMTNEFDGNPPKPEKYETIEIVYLSFGKWDFSTQTFLDGIRQTNEQTRTLLQSQVE